MRKLRNGSPCAQRWHLYERFVGQAMTARQQTQATFPIAKEALDDTALYQALVRRLDYVAMAGACRDMAELRTFLFARNSVRPRTLHALGEIQRLAFHQSPRINVPGGQRASGAIDPANAYTRYFDWIIKSTFDAGPGTPAQSGIDLFLERFPICAHYLHVITQQFGQNLNEAAQHVTTDQQVLQNLFFAGQTIRAVSKIDLTGSDTHKGGKQVLILNLALSGQGPLRRASAKLAFKPSDVELDYRMCGDTNAVAQAFNGHNPMGAQPSLAEWINARLPNPPEHRLPVYRILPRNPGSGLNPAQGVLPIQTSYGYVEYLTRTPDKQDANGNPRSPGRNATRDSDWLCTADESAAFFRVWGKWLAVARVFSWADLHSENIIAHGKRPCPIDLEISCTGPMNSLGGTQVVMTKDVMVGAQEAGLARGGLTGRISQQSSPGIYFDKTANLTIDAINNRVQRNVPTKNRVAVNANGWRLATAGQHMTAILESMRAALRTFADNAGHTAANDGLADWLPSLHHCIGRFTPYGTGSFYNALCVFTEARSMRRQPPNTPGAPNDPWFANINEQLGNSPGWPNPRPNGALQADIHNYEDFCNHDIPAYYHRLNSLDLLNARGQVVNVQGIAADRATYFPQNAIEAVNQQINALHNPQTIEAHLSDAIEVICNRPAEGVVQQILAALAQD